MGLSHQGATQECRDLRLNTPRQGWRIKEDKTMPTRDGDAVEWVDYETTYTEDYGDDLHSPLIINLTEDENDE